MTRNNCVFLLFASLNWTPLLLFLLWLAYREVQTGDPETGRFYFTDIVAQTESSSSALIGMMTTFSYTWLILGSLCAALLAHIRRLQQELAAIRFWGCIAVILMLAGLDERFIWHETIGFRLGIGDTGIVAMYPLLAVLAAWGAGPEIAKFRHNAWLLAPVALGTLLTLAADVVGGKRPFRLLVEDGSKVVATCSIFLLCLRCVLDELDQIRSPRMAPREANKLPVGRGN